MRLQASVDTHTSIHIPKLCSSGAKEDDAELERYWDSSTSPKLRPTFLLESFHLMP